MSRESPSPPGAVRRERSSLWRRALEPLRRLDPVLVAALCVGIALRSWRFGNLPLGFNQDEASTAYDAWSLFHHGIDRNGFRWPVMTVSWGSGMYALASYVEAPFVGLLGLSVTAARLPFLLLGVATIPLFYCLLADLFERRTARIGAVLLALCPWHVMSSRWSLDCNLLPFVFLAATVLLVRSLERPWLLVAAGAGYGLALYAYGTAYVVVPAFLTLAVGYGLVHRRWPWRVSLAAGAVSALVAAPIVLYVAINKLG
ncbi:MAG TPA: glycosyltransferase family 39 protein, partial [Polyangiaceae bacterium]|nr:glycosyltransferase family 39 protein [Polyangiaceae bacterium]